MGRIRKSLALFVILIIVISSLSLFIVKPTNAQSIPKPSVPEFTIKYVDYSTYIPPTYSTDQYTGKTVIAQEGYYQQNKSIISTITNLLFTQALQEQNLTIFYQMEYKGYYGKYWSNLNWSSSNCEYVVSEGHRYLINPNAPYTVATLGFSGNNGSARYGISRFIDDIPNGGQIDFRLRSFVGYFTKVYEPEKYVPGIPEDDPTDPIPHYYAFTGQTSDWSNTHTISIPDGAVSISTSPNPTPSPTNSMASPSPTVPEFPSWTIPLLVMMTVVLIGLVYFKKRKH